MSEYNALKIRNVADEGDNSEVSGLDFGATTENGEPFKHHFGAPPVEAERAESLQLTVCVLGAALSAANAALIIPNGQTLRVSCDANGAPKIENV